MIFKHEVTDMATSYYISNELRVFVLGALIILLIDVDKDEFGCTRCVLVVLYHPS